MKMGIKLFVASIIFFYTMPAPAQLIQIDPATVQTVEVTTIPGREGIYFQTCVGGACTIPGNTCSINNGFWYVPKSGGLVGQFMGLIKLSFTTGLRLVVRGDGSCDAMGHPIANDIGTRRD